MTRLPVCFKTIDSLRSSTVAETILRTEDNRSPFDRECHLWRPLPPGKRSSLSSSNCSARFLRMRINVLHIGSSTLYRRLSVSWRTGSLWHVNFETSTSLCQWELSRIKVQKLCKIIKNSKNLKKLKTKHFFHFIFYYKW